VPRAAVDLVLEPASALGVGTGHCADLHIRVCAGGNGSTAPCFTAPMALAAHALHPLIALMLPIIK
jgi:hypothetical protein